MRGIKPAVWPFPVHVGNTRKVIPMMPDDSKVRPMIPDDSRVIPMMADPEDYERMRFFQGDSPNE